MRLGAAGQKGTTLVELLVVMTILSILAVTALPFAETAAQRRQELALRETLRQTRTALDAFHADWAAGRFEEDAAGVSDNGYPETLAVLVSGLEVTLDAETGATQTRRYLRRLPENPFGGSWRLIGYAQTGATWDREDVWDLRADTSREALDGSAIAEW
ncbi:MAG: prepilin-type N-terminal cleavage/methylation domain-containing protein [Pseudomonadota bacterium]